MTRLFVYVRCEKCNYPYATDNSKSYVGAKGYVKGLCWRCQLKEMKEKREREDE